MTRRLITTLSPEAKITQKLFYADLAIWGVGAGIVGLTHQLIPNIYLKVIYGTLVMTFAIWLSIQPKKNPKKRNYQVINFALNRDRNTYHMIMVSELNYGLSDDERALEDEDVLYDLTKM